MSIPKVLAVDNPSNTREGFRIAELRKDDGTMYYIGLEYGENSLYLPKEYDNVDALYQDLNVIESQK